MLILFDHGTPRSIARWLNEHIVVETMARGWDKLSNGELLNAAEEAGFDVLVTTDKNIRYQQNLKGRRLAIIVLGNPERPAVEKHINRIVAAVNASMPGSYSEVEIPKER
ncbi:MAG TPA: DUF5615 family PIN-like protein [Bryobacteraceae bacterium]|nr:DUF5615 family PIN-like protein [Bryobacteraceae bacterium]